MARKITKRQATEQVTDNRAEATALYIRVSTERQATEGFSLAAQLDRLQSYCHAHGWMVAPAHIYTDAGISGKSTDRPAFQAMLQAAEAGEINRVVAVKLDRVARNTKDFLATVELLQGYGCALALIQEGFDTSTPQGKFAITMFAAMAELEASMISDRVQSGRKQNATVGGYNGSRIPLGYRYTDGVFTVNESEAATVRRIFAWFVDGVGMSAIAQRLNQEGIPTSRGGRWYSSTLRVILSNGFYAGLSQWDGTEVEGTHPAIITPELYEQAHTRLVGLKPGRNAV